jgi:hypothetical protein
MADREDGINRRHALECMIWAGTGVLWTVAGGVPKSMGLLGDAQAAETSASALTFLQISDSHVGFDKPANRYGKNAKGAGWYSFDQAGVHFIGLVNVLDLKAGGLGNLGDEQLAWLEDDVRGKSSSTPIVVFAHVPLWLVYDKWGWGTDDGARALGLLKRFGSVTVLNGHIHQIVQKVEGNMTFHTARSTAFPQPEPGAAPSPGPMLVPAEKLRTMLGLSNVTIASGQRPLAIVDSTLAQM